MNSNYPVPTVTDIAKGFLIVDRILLKRAFEKLKARKHSKYFKNIRITDVSWGVLTPIPDNMPREFLNLYPKDFKVEFTILGCNILKCYKHDYDKPCRGQYIVNGNIPVCSEACSGIFREFNDYLAENFKLNGIIDAKNDTNAKEISFETFSIERPFMDGSTTSNYCGIQLTNLKTLGILPSARWQKPINDNNNFANPSPSASYMTKSQYINTIRDNPMQIADMAGLVDSPPLTWDVEYQNLKYNTQYCERFRKVYDRNTDSCYKPSHREMLGFIFGDATINQFSDSELISLASMPVSYVLFGDHNKRFEFNPGYSERKTSQKKIELGFFNSIPDKIIKRQDVVNIIKPQHERDNEGLMVVHYKDIISQRVGNRVGEAVLDLLSSVGENIIIEEGIESCPTLLTFLLKYYSKTFINTSVRNVIMGGKGLINSGIKFSILILRAIVTEVWVQIAIKSLTMLSQATNIIGFIGLIGLIPEILLSKYNVGGYNRELLRNHLEIQRRATMEQSIKQISSEQHKKRKDFLSPLEYISIQSNSVNGKSLDILSPLVTPEFIYNLCIINFHSTYPENVNDIGRNGLDPTEEYEMVYTYLSFLKINSAGQHIMIHDDNDLSMTETLNNIIISKERKLPEMKNPEYTLNHSTEIIINEIDKHCYDYKSINPTQKFIARNYDLILLVLCIFLSVAFCFSLYRIICKYCKIPVVSIIVSGIMLKTFLILYYIWYKIIIQSR